MEIFSKLNDKQTLAVQNTEGYVRVIAGAGSGKTKLLVSRYAYLVKEYGIDAGNILCVTFTNKAAGEMKKRISNLIGPEYSTSSYINVIELSYSIWDSIPVTYDPITRYLLGAFPVTKTGFLALAGSTQISRMGSSPNLQRGCEPPEIR